MNLASVAAGVPPAVEGGVSPPGIPFHSTRGPAAPSAGQDARLYGRRDARRYDTGVLALHGSSEQVDFEQGTLQEPARVLVIPAPPHPGIPTGFRPKARGWTASRAYPGWEIPRIHNPNGVADGGRNPVGVGSNARPTRGSSFLATPGFGSQSLRD